jgi:hypothetical protein
MEMLIGVGIAAIALVMFVITSLIIIAKFRIVPETDEAVVITGSTVTEKDEVSGEVVQKPKVVVGGGTYVIPIWNKYKIVSLEVVQIPIAWAGEGATLPSKDRIPVILEGELSVVVDGRNEDQIILASQKLGIPTRGTSKAKDFSMAQAVQQKADKIVAAALRTAVFEFEFVELNAKKEDFEKRVHALVQQDLAKYGLTLVSVSIPLVSQGQFSAGKGDMFDEQGRKKVAEIVEKAQTEKNDIEQSNKVARARRDREATEQTLQIQREVAEKTADQEREVAVYQANQTRQQTESILTESKAEELATAQQAREVAEAKAKEAGLLHSRKPSKRPPSVRPRPKRPVRSPSSRLPRSSRKPRSPRTRPSKLPRSPSRRTSRPPRSPRTAKSKRPRSRSRRPSKSQSRDASRPSRLPRSPVSRPSPSRRLRKPEPELHRQKPRPSRPRRRNPSSRSGSGPPPIVRRSSPSSLPTRNGRWHRSRLTSPPTLKP